MEMADNSESFFGLKGMERRLTAILRNKEAAEEEKQRERQRADSPDLDSSSDWSTASTVVEAVQQMQPHRLEPEDDVVDGAAETDADTGEDILPISRARPRFREDPLLPAFLEHERQQQAQERPRMASSPVREGNNPVRRPRK